MLTISTEFQNVYSAIFFFYELLYITERGWLLTGPHTQAAISLSNAQQKYSSIFLQGYFYE